MDNVALFETENYRVRTSVYPSGESAGQNCYGVCNKVTGVTEIFVNLLPKAIYLAKESQTWLDELLTEGNSKPNQLMLLN